MAQGNRGIAGLIAGAGQGGAIEPRRPPTTGILGARENRLAELAAGTMVNRLHEAVDPATCRIWEGHNRNYTRLNERICADLIDSLRSQGRQEVPAIVRRLSGDQTHRYEVICGARRHWSVSWLREHDYPDFKFVVEPRELSDEEAFRIADLENRSREDLSDHERATDYARAIERYYEGSQQRMADRLHVTKSWLSRYLELARLPPEIIACFEAPHVIGISHAAAIAPSLNRPRERAAILTRAATLSGEQRSCAERGASVLAPAQVVARLLDARSKATPVGKSRPKEIRDLDGKLVLKVQEEGRGGLTFNIPTARIRDRRAVVDALDRYLQTFIADR